MREQLSGSYIASGHISPDFYSEAKIYDQEQDDTFQGRPNWEEITELCQSAEAETPKIYDYETEVLEPIQQADKVSLRQRAKRIMGQAGDLLRETSITAMATVQAKAERLNNYYEDGERGNRRQKTSALVAGTLLLGSLTYLELKGIGGGAAVREIHSTATEHSVNPQHHEHIHQLASMRLHSGENPWTVTEDQLHSHGVAHPTDARIVADDKRLLKLNHISKLQALKLHTGDKLKLLKVW